NETLGLSLPSEGVETVAGLITQRLGRVPAEGDRIEIGASALVVTDATATRVARVRVEHAGAPGTDGDTGEAGDA
ncbi:HlyC/CorC family transporter, partial [Halorubrum sp. SD626R]|uniref:transporter associated domain-containing protein n=2 Tax=Halorubrum TaxID=56688 RepID=UPI00113B62A9